MHQKLRLVFWPFRSRSKQILRCLKSPVSTLRFCLNFLTLYVLSPQLLMIPRREKEVPRQYRFLRYTRRYFFFSSSFRSFVRLKYSQKVIVYKSGVELFFMIHWRFGPIGWIRVHEFTFKIIFWVEFCFVTFQNYKSVSAKMWILLWVVIIVLL
jgi:hypothetical protein